jgi:membrane associated rhomboid family serine protease
MPYYEQEYRRRPIFTQENSALLTLISINLIVFILMAFIQAIYHLKFEDSVQANIAYQNDIVSVVALPADLHKLAMRPWTLVTHMFVHGGLWHIFGNMLWLWMFGYILQDLTGNRKVFPVFLYGAFAGAIAFILAYNTPALIAARPFASAVGASAGIMAIAVATTFVAPSYRIFPMLAGGIPLWVITLVYVIIDLVTIPVSNTGGHIAHLAGALTGFLFMYFFRRGYDWGEWMNNAWDWFTNLFNPEKPKRKRELIKQELFYKSGTKPYKKTPNVTEQRVNEILDKISSKGYNSLSEEEKDLLKRASQEK